MLDQSRMPDKSEISLAASTLLLELAPFREFRGTMPLQYVVSFLLVVEEEGLGVIEYAKKAGVSPSVMSRHLLDIGARDRHMEEGFNLVYKRQDPLELRRFRVFLTDKGRAVANRIVRAQRRR